MTILVCDDISSFEVTYILR